ncbi:UPAR/Ly6 domain-containing protein crok-like [Prorops nasuta]|uniref:UPAR/Ly6 domain-containing protein crok-like n=1 Tax=Prorops nasuta TaxID=863751 RepID=UPI0034CFF25F
MATGAQCLLLIFALIVLVQSGSALRCWECQSNSNQLCGDLSNTTEHHRLFHDRLCEQGVTNFYQNHVQVCRKIVKKEYGQRIVIRSCSTLNPDEQGITDGVCGQSMLGSRSSTIESCHICSTDLCNSATSTSAMQLLYASTLLLAIYNFFSSKESAI